MPPASEDRTAHLVRPEPSQSRRIVLSEVAVATASPVTLICSAPRTAFATSLSLSELPSRHIEQKSCSIASRCLRDHVRTGKIPEPNGQDPEAAPEAGRRLVDVPSSRLVESRPSRTLSAEPATG